ncbi:unnamed protein product [Meganyctiphanes norvegica]|uniref:Uncharacterized protein n=1 Tax=Meganyctiphanes norvegica TaxID=48144 RepID=A0AAV2S213_MEGNR
MPNTSNDTDSLRLLTEELGMEEIKVKKSFRISARYSRNPDPPLKIEFFTLDDKYNTLRIIRNKIGDINSNSQFYGISVAPDRSYKERQEYRLLRIEMDSKN